MKHLLLILSFAAFISCDKDCDPEIVSRTLTLQPGSEGKDAFVSSYSGDMSNNHGTDTDFPLYAWTISSTNYKTRSFIEFDLSTIPSDATIESAKLSFYSFHAFPYPPSSEGHQGTNSFYIRRVTSTWEETTLIWNNQPSTTTDNQIIIPQTTSPNQDFTDIDVTTLIRNIISSGTNHGLSLSLVNEEPYAYLGMGSSDQSNPTRRPKLIVEYSYTD